MREKADCFDAISLDSERKSLKMKEEVKEDFKSWACVSTPSGEANSNRQ
jgi:hypothetical protein